ncbi:putative receptor-like protein kinase At5g20050 [Silene latifolia]|uniref:putative receptor-like protein kinase At5g20050 n=1 Tax=Silene latifolia TaxID=37657 RepID=UPI003D76FA03
MEDKKSKILAFMIIVILVTIITVSSLYLGTSWKFFFVFGTCFVMIIAVFIWLICRRSKETTILPRNQLRPLSREISVAGSFLRKVAGIPTKFRHKELELATDNFNTLIGKGASGSVFRGILGDGTCIAVKRIDGQDQRGEKEFLSEVAAIGSVQHINLVRLYGYCVVPSGPRFLVYEFIQKGSLDGWIFSQRHSRTRPKGCLPWHLRYNVAIDVAKALTYLHRDCRSRILHLDVKPENILIDDEYRAVVTDFGLSKLMGRDESKILTNLRGTKGYLAPEWILEKGISEKSDVYSYGMVLLEMIGGTRNVCLIEDNKDRSLRKYEYFPKIVVEKMKAGKIMSVVDQRLLEGRNIDETQVRKLVHIALWCIQEKPRLRPTMAKVVDMLEGTLRVDEPPETEMIIVDLLSIGNANGNGKMRMKATGVVLSGPSDHSNAPVSAAAFESTTMFSGR